MNSKALPRETQCHSFLVGFENTDFRGVIVEEYSISVLAVGNLIKISL